MFKEFKEFALKGSMVDLAIGVILGAAFGAAINSLVKDVLMPLIGMALGGADFTNMFLVLKEGSPTAPYATLAAAVEAGAATLNYGAFINAIITFFAVALTTFAMVKIMNRLRREKEEATSKECPFCATEIALSATRCPACTSEVPAQ